MLVVAQGNYPLDKKGRSYLPLLCEMANLTRCSSTIMDGVNAYHHDRADNVRLGKQLITRTIPMRGGPDGLECLTDRLKRQADLQD